MFAKKKNLKREDFLFQSGWFETITKYPKSLHMQQFQISDCQQCEIYLFDSSAGVYIDDCKYCYIFIGPSESSIFVRNCEYVNIICITQQFRMRQCYNCNIILWCEAQPIIESSYGIRIGPYPRMAYQQMKDQIKEASLTGWTNNWFDVFDFTPSKYYRENRQEGRQGNWQSINIIQYDQTMKNMIQKLQQKVQSERLVIKERFFPNIIGINQIKSASQYNVAVIYPIPLSAQNIRNSFYQSRISLPPSIVPHKDQKKPMLFVKISPMGCNDLKKQMEDSLILIINDTKIKQELESSVFAPFRDQH